MKKRSKLVFNIFTLFSLMVMLFGVVPVLPMQSVRAESLGKPLYASGDFIWAKQFGSTLYDTGRSIVVDGSGNVYTTGYFQGTVDFDPGAGITNLVSAGNRDAYVTKLDSTGSLVWAKKFGGTNNEYAYSIAVDGSGNVYTTGLFGSTADFDPGAGTFNLIAVGSLDAYVSKLDSSGNFVWAKQFGGTGFEGGYTIAVDGSSNVYTTGFFETTVDFDPGAGTVNLISAGGDDAFISKLDSSGNFVWVKQIGGTGDDITFGVAIDTSNNIYTTGYFNNTVDFDPGAGTVNLISAGLSDGFISKLDSSGNFVWVKQFAGTDYGDVEGIVLDASNNVYTTGYFDSTVDFDPGLGTSNLTSGGGDDVFVSKLDSNGNFIWAKQFGGASHQWGVSVVVDGNGNVFTTGGFGGTADFDPGAGISNLTSFGGYDAFVSKLDGNGNFVWAKQLGGTTDDFVSDIALGTASVYTTGSFSGTADFDPGVGTSNLVSNGSNDAFVSKLEDTTTLVNSVLPTSRTPVVGNMVTIFNTIINAGANTATGITLSMNPAPAGTFVYQQTSCATNAIIGSPNPSLDLAPGGVLCYVLSFTPSATFAATNVHIRAQAANAPSTNLLTGINTWLLRSTAAAGPDIIALTTTVDFHQVPCSGVDAFAVALSNVGVAATGDITVTANTGSASLPLSLSVSETNPGTGAIIGDNVLQSVGAGENRTVGVFVGYGGCISFDPAVNRIFVEFRDASNNVIGSTSTAISTNR